MARTGNDEKASLIRDLYNGTLDTRFEIPADIRAQLDWRIRRRRIKQARKLEAIVERGGGKFEIVLLSQLEQIHDIGGIVVLDAVARGKRGVEIADRFFLVPLVATRHRASLVCPPQVLVLGQQPIGLLTLEVANHQPRADSAERSFHSGRRSNI